MTKNRALQEEIMRDHLAVSQFPSGTKVGKHTFPIRNRTMALLSDATVIIEARDRSGSLHQGWELRFAERPPAVRRVHPGDTWANANIGHLVEPILAQYWTSRRGAVVLWQSARTNRAPDNNML